MTESCFDKGSFTPEELTRLKALADPIRLAIYSLLDEPRTVTDIASLLETDRKALYHHVKLLRTSGLIEESDSRFVKNLKEITYRRSENIMMDSLAALLWSDAGGKILSAIRAFSDDANETEYRDRDSIATVSRKRFMVNSDRLEEVRDKIISYREEYCRKVMALAEKEEGELTEIELMCIFFDR